MDSCCDFRKRTKFSERIAKKLLEKGAVVNAIDAHGRTALHYACLHRNSDAIEILVKAGAEWDIKDKNNQSPLDFCYTDYKTASTILRNVTGGIKDYTFTLQQENFDSSNEFYQSLSKITSIDTKHLEVSNNLNRKLESALKPIYEHAKKLCAQYDKENYFEDYAICIMNKDYNKLPLSEVSDSIGSRKFKALLTVYFDLKNTASARIDLATDSIIFSGNDKIEEIVNTTLVNSRTYK